MTIQPRQTASFLLLLVCGRVHSHNPPPSFQHPWHAPGEQQIRDTPTRLTGAVIVSEPVESIAGLRNKPEIVNLAIVGNKVQAATVTPQANNLYAGFVIISQTQKYFIYALTITGNQFSGANTNNGQQIMLTNAPYFVYNQQISSNTYNDGTTVNVDLVQPWQ